MIKASFEQLVDRIAKESGQSVEEIRRRIDAKRAKLNNLISMEGAAQVVAAELGINFEKKDVKINELLSGMRGISITGKIIKIFPVRAFKTKNADSRMVSFVLADKTGNVRTILWDTNHVALIEEGKIHEGSVVEIKNAFVRGTDMKEIHLGSGGEIKKSETPMDNVVTEEKMARKEISKLRPNDRATVRATVVQMFEPRFFFVCPECNSKLTQENGKFICSKHGPVAPQERALINLVLDDGSGNIRAVCFSENIGKLLNCEIQQLKDPSFFIFKKEGVLGSELFLSGGIRQNKLYNNLELFVQDLSIANVDDVIADLKK